MISRFPLGFALLLCLAPSCSSGGSSAPANPPPAPDAPIDTIAPTLDWKSPSQLLSGKPAAVELDASDDQGLARVEAFVDGVSLGEITQAPFHWSFLPSGLPGTLHEFTAQAEDAAGNLAQAQTLSLAIGLGGSAEISVLSWQEVSPAVFRMKYEVPSNPDWAQPSLLVSTDGGSSLQSASLVGTGSTPDGKLFLEWNSALDFGVVDLPGMLAALVLQDSQGVWHCAEPTSFDLENKIRIEEYRSTLFPDFDDMLDHSSPFFTKVMPSLTSSLLPGGIVKKEFVFDSPHFRQSGPPSNVCAGCDSWKKDIWTNVPCTLYLPTGEDPKDFVLMGVLTGNATIWAPEFSSLFPEFNDGSIVGAGDPAQAGTANFEETVIKTVQELKVGVLVGAFMQAGGAVPGSAPGVAIASYDEVLFTGQPRWNVWVGAAEAMMRALTATEIVQGKAPGSLRFAVQGSSKHGWTASFAAAADPRIIGAYLHVSAGMGEWDLLGETATQYFTPQLQTNWDAALSGLLAAGYPLHSPLNLPGMAQISAMPSYEIWHRTSDPSTQIALSLLQGKIVHQQEDTADWNFDLRLRGQWFDDTLRRRYPGSSIRMSHTANGDHSNSGPQDFKNLRSFSASALFGRPRSDVEAQALPQPGGIVLVTAQVANPAPGQIEIVSARLRYGFDDDDDWRHYGLPAPDQASGCSKPFEMEPVICFGEGNFFLNRNFQSVPMTPTGVPGQYSASIDLGTLGTHADREIALFVEVEDRPIAGAIPPLVSSNRYFHSSRFFFFTK